MAINPSGLKYLNPETVIALAPDIFAGLDLVTGVFDASAKNKGATVSVPLAPSVLGRKNATTFNVGEQTSLADVTVDYYDFPIEISQDEYVNGYNSAAFTSALLSGLRNTLVNALCGAVVQTTPTLVDDLTGLNLELDGGYKVLLAKPAFLASSVPQADRNAWKWQGDRLEAGAYGFDAIQKVPALISGLTAGAIAFTKGKTAGAWGVPTVPSGIAQQVVDLGFNGMRVVLTEKETEATESIIINARIIAGFKALDAKVFGINPV